MMKTNNNQEMTVKMKLIAMLGLMLMGAMARAGSTVTLEPSTSPCLNAYYCTNVANSANEDIAVIIYSMHYGRLSAIIDGVLWDSGLWALGSNNGAVQPSVSLTLVPLYNGGGGIIYMSIEFTGGQVTGPCHQQGRVCVFPHAPVNIVSGSISIP